MVIKDIIDEEIQRLEKQMELNEALLNRFGIRTIHYLQCIRCGAKFTSEQKELCWQHLDMCKLVNKIEST